MNPMPITPDDEAFDKMLKLTGNKKAKKSRKKARPTYIDQPDCDVTIMACRVFPDKNKKAFLGIKTIVEFGDEIFSHVNDLTGARVEGEFSTKERPELGCFILQGVTVKIPV